VGVLTKTSAALWSAGCPRPEGRRRGVRLDVRVAVRLDSETLLASVGQDVSESGRECLVNDARGRSLKPNRGSLVPLWPKFICGCVPGA